MKAEKLSHLHTIHEEFPYKHPMLTRTPKVTDITKLAAFEEMMAKHRGAPEVKSFKIKIKK